ncbi:hypothetical protein MgSA37_03559 [Mucilaginibacter gotjawali]|nr:hypothetical protein MgSA37_03559 [Mucilaginibacter gotjawali]
MFHELWVGMDKESSIKHTYWGALQKMLINSLIRKLNPVFIHTQTQVYKAQLIAMGYKPELLPLFSNIKRDGKLTGTKSSGDVLKIIVFGIIQERCFIKEFANDAAEYSIKNKRPISILFAGRLGARIVEWKSVIETSGLTIEIIGEQTAETISMLLSGADFGLSSTPLAQMEKSGAFAAMREHDLPVICIARQWTPRNVRFEPPHGVFNYPAMSFADIITGGITFQSEKQPAGNGLSAVTRLFVNSVQPESELHT